MSTYRDTLQTWRSVSLSLCTLALPVDAQQEETEEFVELRALGGPNAFCPPALRPLRMPQALLEAQADDLRAVIREGFRDLPASAVDSLIDDLFRKMEQFDGAVQPYEMGTELRWMAVRRNGAPGLVGPVRWIGEEPMPGFQIVARSPGRRHTFVIPTACCNISLLRSCELPAPPQVEVEVCPSCSGSPVIVKAEAGDAAADVELQLTLTGPDGVTTTAEGTGQLEWPQDLETPGAYTLTAVARTACGPSETVTRTFEIPEDSDIEPNLEVALTGDESGNHVTATVTIGPELARRVIVSDGSVQPATDAERLDQLLATATLDLIVTASGQDAPPVTLSNGERTENGIRWEQALELGSPGSYTLTAVVKTGWGGCEARATFPLVLPECSLRIGTPIRIPGGQAKVDIDVCSQTMAEGGSHEVEVRRDGVVVDKLILDSCGQTSVIEQSGLHTFTAVAIDARGVRSTNSCEAEVDWRLPSLYPFVGVFTGIERRWRVHDEPDLTAGLIGGSGGVMFPVAEHLGLFGRVGGVVNTRESEFSSLFADVGADVLLRKGFIGGGVGIWDFTHSDWRDGSVFVHGGVDTPWRLGDATVQWFVEGRLFTGMLDMIDNNYSGFTGLRLIWKGPPIERR